MSQETLTWLNTQTLIGFTEKRGNAWHYREQNQDTEGNHYPGAIPIDDVLRRLFNFDVIEQPLYITIPGDDGPIYTCNVAYSLNGDCNHKCYSYECDCYCK